MEDRPRRRLGRGGPASDRRRLLRAGGAGIVGALAGCLGGEDHGEPDDPDDAPAGTPEGADRLAAALDDAPAWRTHQYDGARTGRASGGPTDDVETVWRHREYEPGPGTDVSSPAVVDGTVYVGEGQYVDDVAETVVYALDGATGEIDWEWTFDGVNGVGPLTVADGRVVFVVGGQLVALDADDGTELVRVGDELTDSVTVADGVAYATRLAYADPATLYAFDLESRSVRWTHELTAELLVPSTPAVVDDTVYAGHEAVEALSAADGTVQWREPVDATVTGAPAVVDDAVYVPVSDVTVRAYDRDGGGHLWTGSVAGGAGDGGILDASIRSVAVDDESVYATNAWTLTALDRDDGDRRWDTSTVGTRAPVVAGGAVYVSGIDTLAAHDAADGEVLWTFDTSASRGTGTGPVVLDEAAFFASDGLYALLER